MIAAQCREIFERLGVEIFFETGTDKAETVAEVARWFAERDAAFGRIVGYQTTGARSYNWWNRPIQYPIFEHAAPHRFQVHSVDVDETSHAEAVRLFSSNCNIRMHFGSSPEVLERFIDGVGSDDGIRYGFYLDAHWGKYWPLRDELRQVTRLSSFAIVIDDFWVPGKSRPSTPHGKYGYDVYDGRPLDWSYIHDLFASHVVQVFYPSEPNRDRRGWVLIVAGYRPDQLGFLKLLGMTMVDPQASWHVRRNKVSVIGRLDWRNMVKKLVPVPILREFFRTLERLVGVGESTLGDSEHAVARGDDRVAPPMS